LPVIVENVTSDIGLVVQLSLAIEKAIRTNNADAKNIKRTDLNHDFRLDEENCSGIFVNVSLGNIGIIAKLLNCGFLTVIAFSQYCKKKTLFPDKLAETIMNVSGYLTDEF